MRVLLDVNVLLDVVLAREPHRDAACRCLAAVEQGRCEGRVSAHAVTTLFYLCRRALGEKRARAVVADLLAICEVAAVEDTTIRRALTLDLADFEDAVGVAAAEAANCDAVVTRDPVGFAGSSIPAVAPVLLLTLLAEEVREPSVGSSRRRGAPAISNLAGPAPSVPAVAREFAAKTRRRRSGR